MDKSIRGKYWRCSNCREFVPDEIAVCECGKERYAHTGKYAGIHVSVLPPGLRGDQMFVYRQNGKQVMDKMKAKQEAKALQGVKDQIDSTPHGPGSLEHYRGESSQTN